MPSTRWRDDQLPRTNGAAAISAVAASAPKIAAHTSTRVGAVPSSTGTISKSSVDAATTKNPEESRRSKRRPSTEKRIPASTATIAPARVIAVSRTSPSAGTSQAWRSLG